MLIVNFFAGPGAGKSTAAAQTFSHLKLAGVNCELVTEFAKDMTWDQSTRCLGYQPYVFAQQAWRIERLRGHVEVVVTDSPLLLTHVYAEAGTPSCFLDYVLWEHRRDPSMNFRLRRVKPYVRVGRSQTEEEARKIDKKIDHMLDRLEIQTEEIVGDGSAAIVAFGHINQWMGRTRP